MCSAATALAAAVSGDLDGQAAHLGARPNYQAHLLDMIFELFWQVGVPFLKNKIFFPIDKRKKRRKWKEKITKKKTQNPLMV